MPEETPAPETPEPAAKNEGVSKPVNRTAFTPEAKIELTRDRGFRIILDKAQLADLFGQDIVLTDGGQGCISAPGGPSC